MKVDLLQITEFFKLLYSDPDWLGVINIEVMELGQTNGRRTSRRKSHKVITCLEDIENLEKSAMDLMSSAGYHFFYTCAFTDMAPERKKDNVMGVPALWADVDDVSEEEMKERLLDCPLHPSVIVATGGGYHLYWKLDHYYEIDSQVEEALKRVRDWVHAPPGTTDVTRLLRLPGTWNSKSWKYKEPRSCRIEHTNSWKYTLDQVVNAKMCLGEINLPLDFKVKYIKNGEFLGETSDRSARDYAVVKELLSAGHSVDEIKKIFTNPDFKVSSKTLERGESYIDATIKNAAQEAGSHKGLSIYNEGGCVHKRKLTTQGVVVVEKISNFTLVPTRYIHDVIDNTELCEFELCVRGRSKIQFLTAQDLTMSKRAITALGTPGLAWTATEADWASYIKYLFDRDVPIIKASSVVGWYESAFVFPDETWFADDIVYVKSGKAYPRFLATKGDDEVAIEQIMKDMFEWCKKLHRLDAVLPSLGWVFASAFAPRIRDKYDKQFPLLSLEGLPGKGKTTMIRTLTGALYGLDTDYTMETSLAVLRRAIAGTNVVPVIIDEYQHDRKNPLSKHVNATLRSAYVAGQTQRMALNEQHKFEVDDFKLLAPVAITSITGFEDEALRDRAVNVRVQPFNSFTGREALTWFKKIPQKRLLKWWLQQDPTEWIAKIADNRNLINESDRQQFGFGVIASVLEFLSNKFGWGLSVADIATCSKESAPSDSKLSPVDLLDVLITRCFRDHGSWLQGQNWQYDGGHLHIQQAPLVDYLVDMCQTLDMGVPITRHWAIKTIADLKTGGDVIASNAVKFLGKKAVRCLVLDLKKYPQLSEAVHQYL